MSNLELLIEKLTGSGEIDGSTLLDLIHQFYILGKLKVVTYYSYVFSGMQLEDRQKKAALKLLAIHQATILEELALSEAREHLLPSPFDAIDTINAYKDMSKQEAKK